jgi:hypothetical protein
VQLNLSFLTFIFLTVLGIDVAYLTRRDKISGIPSPVTPDVGTKGI